MCSRHSAATSCRAWLATSTEHQAGLLGLGLTPCCARWLCQGGWGSAVGKEPTAHAGTHMENIGRCSVVAVRQVWCVHVREVHVWALPAPHVDIFLHLTCRSCGML